MTGHIRFLGKYNGRPLPSVNAIFPLRPRQYCTGLMPRNSGAVEFFNPYIGSFVHELKWNEWQPFNGTGLDATKVAQTEAILDWAEANGKRVRFRFFAGLYAPTWATAVAGAMDWYEYKKDVGETFKGIIPKWWDSSYRAVYNDWMDLLIAQFADHPALAEVTNSRCMTVFAETMNRQWGSDHNVQTAYDNGYTVAVDMNDQKQAYIDMRAWGEAGVATYSAFNPWQEPKNLETTQLGGVKVNPAGTYDLLNYFRSALGRCGVWANNSICSPITIRGPRYADMWGYMSAYALNPYPFHMPTGYQTVNTNVMTQMAGNVADTATMLLSMGAMSMEVPEGWLSNPNIMMTGEQAIEFNELFLENNAIVEAI